MIGLYGLFFFFVYVKVYATLYFFNLCDRVRSPAFFCAGFPPKLQIRTRKTVR